MEMALTAKIQIYPDKLQISRLNKTREQYGAACNWLSERAFEDGVYTAFKLQDKYYEQIRSKFGLGAQMAVSVTRTVASKYATVKEQFKKKPFVYTDKKSKKTYKYKRDLSWLQNPIHFSKPQVDLVRNRDWSFKNNETLSLNTVKGRIHVKCNKKGFEKYFTDAYTFGTSRIINKNDKWYVYISATTEIPEPDDFNNIVGIDRGIINTISIFDNNDTKLNISGKELQDKRSKYVKVRASLQSKGTKGAKRVLKRLSGRENGWMNDVNHCFSKALVSKYGPKTLFVLEDLDGVSFDNCNYNEEQNNSLRSWSFYDLQTKLSYKALLSGSKVITVDSAFTSQRCPICGNIDADARNRDEHVYTCKCGFKENDDITAAMNIHQLGLMYLAGNDNPHFTKPKETKKKTKKKKATF